MTAPSCCMICNSFASANLWFAKKTTDSEYPILRCAACKSAYVWPRPNGDTIQKIYSSQTYHPDKEDGGVYWPSGETDAKVLFRRFDSHLARGRLLDIGAGDGIASAEAVRRGFEVSACEPSLRARKRFVERLGFEPDSTFFNAEYAEANRGKFDAALLSHVLEHILEPMPFLRNIRMVLKPGGVLLIAVPLFGSVLTAAMGKKDFFITPPVHLTYFSHAGLAELLHESGFKMIASYTSSKVNMNRYKTRLGWARYAINVSGYCVLKVSELFQRSIVLNMCAKRI